MLKDENPNFSKFTKNSEDTLKSVVKNEDLKELFTTKVKQDITQLESNLINDDEVSNTALGLEVKKFNYGVQAAAESISIVSTVGKVLTKKTSVSELKNKVINSGKGVLKAVNSEIRAFNPDSEDVATKTILGAKNTIYGTVDTVKNTHHSVRLLLNTISTIPTKIKAFVQAIKKASIVAKVILLNPITILLLPVSFVIIFFLQVVSAIFMPLAFSHSADVKDLNAVYKYITEVQTDIQLDFLNFDVKKFVPNIEYKNITFTMEFDESEFPNPYKVLSLFSCKYEDTLSLNVVKTEVAKLYNNLYEVSHNTWSDTVIENDLDKPIVDVDGKPELDEDGNPKYEQIEKVIDYAEVFLKNKISFDDWIEQNKMTFFDTADGEELKEKLEFVETLSEFGFIFYKSLIRPFEDDYYFSSKYGYRVDPNSPIIDETTGERNWLKQFHNALDIPKAQDTPIRSAISGTASVGYAPENYGFWVIIENADEKIRYAHCNSLNVKNGQTINSGDIIAFVGTTGATSTGNHLHFEYFFEGKNLNPEFFTEEFEE